MTSDIPLTVEAGAGVAPRVEAVGQEHRHRHRVVRDHLLGDGGDAVEQLAQLRGVGHRREHLVEPLEVLGPGLQLRVRPCFLGQAVVRQRERDVIGNPPPDEHVVGA